MSLKKKHSNKHIVESETNFANVCKRMKLQSENANSSDNSVENTAITTENAYLFFNIPKSGEPINRRELRKAGSYILGPEMPISSHNTINSISQYLGRKENSNEFYTLKMLQFPHPENKSKENIKASVLLHTEHSILSLLSDTEGVIKHHGMFTDLAIEQKASSSGELFYTGNVVKRTVLVLDCLFNHPYRERPSPWVSLRDFVAREVLYECQAVHILLEIAKIVENIHQKNVVNCNLKMPTIFLNTTNNQIMITNFCYAKYLSNSTTHRSIQDNSCDGKLTDMKTLGIIFYHLLSAVFSFEIPPDYTRQISAGDILIPSSTNISDPLLEILRRLLSNNLGNQYNAKELRKRLEYLIKVKRTRSMDQRVPSIRDRSHTKQTSSSNGTIVNSREIISKYFNSPVYLQNNDQVVPDGKSEGKECRETVSKLHEVDRIVPSTTSTFMAQNLKTENHDHVFEKEFPLDQLNNLRISNYEDVVIII